jgi:hypothetical protein
MLYKNFVLMYVGTYNTTIHTPALQWCNGFVVGNFLSHSRGIGTLDHLIQRQLLYLLYLDSTAGWPDWTNFCLLGDCSVLKNTAVVQKLCINFDKKLAGLHFGHLFQKLIWHTAPRVYTRWHELVVVKGYLHDEWFWVIQHLRTLYVQHLLTWYNTFQHR